MNNQLNRYFAKSQKLPQMRRQVHITVPGIESTQIASDRCSIKTGSRNRNRLDFYLRSIGQGAFGNTEQSRFERQHTVAIVACAFREQDQFVPIGKTPGNLVILLASAGRATLDKSGSLQLGKRSEDRPAGDLGLGNETASNQGPQHRNIEIGCVVGHNNTRTVHQLCPGNAKLNMKDFQAKRMIKPRQIIGQSQSKCNCHHLNRDQDQSQQGIGQQPDGCTRITVHDTLAVRS